MNHKGETCLDWLARVSTDSGSPAARRAAALDLSEHHRFNNITKRRVRRSAWDIASGAHGHILGTNIAEARYKGQVFRFHVYAEAADRRGVMRPSHAIVTGLSVEGHRVPQPHHPRGAPFLRT